MTDTSTRRFVRAALGGLLGTLAMVAIACGSDGPGADGTPLPQDPSSAPPTSGGGGSPEVTAPSAPAATSPAVSVAPPTTLELSSTDLPIIHGRPQPPPKGPTDTFRPFTTRGRVEAGTEPGCLVLVTEAGRLVLLGDLATGLAVGDVVEVDVLAAPNAVTSCQGDAIEVLAVRPS